jgi:hypothetical protein
MGSVAAHSAIDRTQSAVDAGNSDNPPCGTTVPDADGSDRLPALARAAHSPSRRSMTPFAARAFSFQP